MSDIKVLGYPTVVGPDGNPVQFEVVEDVVKDKSSGHKSDHKSDHRRHKSK